MKLTEDNAQLWVHQANKDKEGGPTWDWDCQFKLDFDGDVLSIASRFRRSDRHGPLDGAWEGTVWVYLLSNLITQQGFKGKDVNEIRDKAEAYVQDLATKIKAAIL